MTATFFSTLASIGGTILAIIVTFYGAYLVYLRRQRDRYREKIITDFQTLDNLIYRFSLLEDLTRPIHIPTSWARPTGRWFAIIEQESWKNSPMEALNEDVQKLKQIYRKTREEEDKLEHKLLERGTHRRLPARAAHYLKVSFALRDLISRLYQEFPPPPGEYNVKEKWFLRSFIKCAFPNNKDAFMAWAKRFDAFYAGAMDLYYDIRPIILTLKQVKMEEVESLKGSLTNLKEIRGGELSRWEEESFRFAQEYSITEAKYYDEFFRVLMEIKHKIDEAKDKIMTYDGYKYEGKWLTYLLLLVMAISGIAIPMFMLLPFKLQWLPEDILAILISLIFASAALGVGYSIHRDISRL